jgi:hypothetical protein
LASAWTLSRVLTLSQVRSQGLGASAVQIGLDLGQDFLDVQARVPGENSG